ncbi:Arc/MetJ family transcription regulator [Spinactinospora alkalitolerans]|uniref:Arc/MetJ family transcription regulator n=1 Tax=Spinactinospora alkalitolerans TaxID=687207 RepID=A0A852U157_9ACTN|nr:type II toxin-antitoxin system VapB family antitoxin [Spinactinospora alkalitolerans]NYE49949.1 Arc/MetJ family transcription regulator [Spinactinospora alkalitolerans]
MGRTNIDIDDELIAVVMEKYHLKTKREAVDFSLRRLAGSGLRYQLMEELEGSGWEGDLDQMRRSKIQDWE